MLKCRFVGREEFAAISDRRMAEHDAWKAANPDNDGWPEERLAINRRAWPPGLMWEAHWFHDPADPEKAELRARMKARTDAEFNANPTYLSRHYWRDWSHIRPPICVICPSGVEWCVDAKSSNGTGWIVTGTPPLITCSPSIDVTGYHGFLQNGEFTSPV